MPEIVAGLAGGKASSERADPAVETGDGALSDPTQTGLEFAEWHFRWGSDPVSIGAEDMLLLLPELRSTPDATNGPARLPGPIKPSTIINVFQAGHRNTSHETFRIASWLKEQRTAGLGEKKTTLYEHARHRFGNSLTRHI